MSILQDLHDSEINAKISWFFDGCWEVSIGDDWNGFIAETTKCSSFEEVEQWLIENALKIFPDSNFSRAYREEDNTTTDGHKDN